MYFCKVLDTKVEIEKVSTCDTKNMKMGEDVGFAVHF